ncbi:proteasome subunit alpha [Actinoplanes couchii]|uniref:Proteasome subunit alpha n=1 Tax=Actinoplanes couchii TaxID=403638 RepID=A0ABQ3X108_9ACTN|nr:proteasome subunit alpha [Actinoplanes couchii]MDR6316552.1 proteasome alpha subunit [Actinoplanes couchii]GID52166.1 proteasome subunit alpha [Actinoplanes couchii]
MAMQFYASPEQVQRDRSEYARKGIARGRSAVVLTYEGGILLVAENITTLRKISEIYDKIAFAAVGRYNEFEALRRGGVRMADMVGLSYDRRDVTARALANTYTQTLGAIFSETQKPYEVEICVAQVGATPEADELYRITYDGSVMDEPGFMAMGGQAEAIGTVLRDRHDPSAELTAALALAAEALGSVGGENGQARTLTPKQLEVAVLDRRRPGRAFRRLSGASLTSLLGHESVPESELGDVDAAPPAPSEGKPVVSAAPETDEDSQK